MEKTKKKFNIFNILLILVFVVLLLYSLSFILLIAWGFLTSLKSVSITYFYLFVNAIFYPVYMQKMHT